MNGILLPKSVEKDLGLHMEVPENQVNNAQKR